MSRLFLDANVLFSAAYRPDAGVAQLWKVPGVTLVTSSYVVEEARRNLSDQEQRSRLARLLEKVEVGEAMMLPPELRGEVDLPALDSAWDLEALAVRRREMLSALRRTDGRFGPRAALTVLREMLPDDGVMTCDVGAHTHLIGQHWRTPFPGAQVMTNGGSSMGFGIPSHSTNRPRT